MIVVSILSQKGGAGKTTLSLHWAVEAERQGFGPVAIIDIDPQGSARKWAERRRENLGLETPITIKADEDTLWRNDVTMSDVMMALKGESINMVIIDTMPRVEAPCVEAARLADFAVIPCGPSILDIEAMGPSVEILESTGTSAGVVVTQARPNSSINSAAAGKLDSYGLQICPTHIVRRAALMDSLIDGKAVQEWRPRDKAAERDITNSWVWIAYQMERLKDEQRRQIG
jgi:chromosome partitioning protein